MAPSLNLAVGRVILGSYLIWKTVWYDWTMVTAVPFAFSNAYTFALPPVPLLLTIEKWVLIVSLLAFIVGYRLQAATFSSAFVLAHLATVRFTVNTSGGTTALFISVSILILFGLYHEQDELFPRRCPADE